MNNKDIIKKAIKSEFDKDKNYQIIMNRKKEKFTTKNLFLKYSFAFTFVILLGLGLFMLNGTNNILTPEEKTITIEGAEWYSYYDMGVNKKGLPKSPVYAYAIKEEKESFKIVSLHEDGTIFDLVAVPVTKISKDNTWLANYYKLIVIDNKLYFTIKSYWNEGDTLENRSSDYDLEVYRIDLDEEHPKLKAELQLVKEDYCDAYSIPIIADGYYYYLNAPEDKIEVLPLGNNVYKDSIVTGKHITNYYIKDDKAYIISGYVSDPQPESSYYIVDLNKKDENGYNILEKITEEEWVDNYDGFKIDSVDFKIHYFQYYNRYLTLYADNIKVDFNANSIRGKSSLMEGNSITVEGKKIIINKTSKNLQMMNTMGSKVNFCLSTSYDCEEYISYDVRTGKIEETEETFSYMILVYNN